MDLLQAYLWTDKVFYLTQIIPFSKVSDVFEPDNNLFIQSEILTKSLKGLHVN